MRAAYGDALWVEAVPAGEVSIDAWLSPIHRAQAQTLSLEGKGAQQVDSAKNTAEDGNEQAIEGTRRPAGGQHRPQYF